MTKKRMHSKKFCTEEDDKRAHHNALERKRRDHIKESFSTLRTIIPPLAHEKFFKMSRAQVLTHATNYIKHMTKKINTYKRESDIIEKENSNMYKRVKYLESQLNLPSKSFDSAPNQDYSSIDVVENTGNNSSCSE